MSRRATSRTSTASSLLSLVFAGVFLSSPASSIRSTDISSPTYPPLKVAVFALGSFWRSESAFGCLHGVVRTTVGYSGGTKPNPEYRNLADHAESVQIEYDPRILSFRQLLEVFWSSHDSRQVFGQGPDVGNQYRSIIFTNGTSESRLAAVSKEKEQTKSKGNVVTTQIQPLGIFYPAEPEHQMQARGMKAIKEEKSQKNDWPLVQKFELKRNPFLLHLIGNLPEEELEKSTLAAKLNSYAAELCPWKVQNQIDSKINEIIRKGWPVLKDI